MKCFNILLSILILPTTQALQTVIPPRSTLVTTTNEITTSRRMLFHSFLVTGASTVAFTGSVAHALDMDAFIKSELDTDTKNCDPRQDPKCKVNLSEDEALCKYGQSGKARGEACKRWKATGGELPKSGSQGRSFGGAYAI